MEGKDHARIHTGRNDRNGRPRGSRRRTSLPWAPSPATVESAHLHDAESTARALEYLEAFRPEAEAGHQSLDGVHPRDEG